MSNVTLFGFPRSTFVKVPGLILTARNVKPIEHAREWMHHHRPAA